MRHKDAQAALDAGARFCYTVNANCEKDEHGIVPSAVFEHTPYHYPMLGNGRHAQPWYWGKTLDEAQQVCDVANAKLGLSPVDVAEIIASSMAVSFTRRRAS